ncbi:MAG: hypothetical protein M5U26_17950 [Planctomycetota bacterium]|nr:hypothetical protein [Planctomycetota bacterium]
MDRAGHQFLARAALAQHQHDGVRRRGAFDETVDLLHVVAFADQVVLALEFLQQPLLADQGVFQAPQARERRRGLQAGGGEQFLILAVEILPAQAVGVDEPVNLVAAQDRHAHRAADALLADRLRAHETGVRAGGGEDRAARAHGVIDDGSRNRDAAEHRGALPRFGLLQVQLRDVPAPGLVDQDRRDTVGLQRHLEPLGQHRKELLDDGGLGTGASDGIEGAQGAVGTLQRGRRLAHDRNGRRQRRIADLRAFQAQERKGGVELQRLEAVAALPRPARRGHRPHGQAGGQHRVVPPAQVALGRFLHRKAQARLANGDLVAFLQFMRGNRLAVDERAVLAAQVAEQAAVLARVDFHVHPGGLGIVDTEFQCRVATDPVSLTGIQADDAAVVGTVEDRKMRHAAGNLEP